MSTKSEQTVEVEIFRAGGYPQGEFTAADLDDIAAAYDPAVHEAPVTLDHARSGPALAWVASVRRAGDRLVAVLRGVSERLRELVRGGAYAKRSAEIYLDFGGTGKKYLRAVTFLGAGVPEVKGLAEASFSEQGLEQGADEGGEYAAIPCALKPGIAELLRRRLKGLLRLLDAQATPEQPQAQSAADVALFEERLAAVRQQAKDEAKAEAMTELAAQRQELAHSRRAHDVALFVERLTGEGRVLPAWAEGLSAFTLHLEESQGEAVARFGEGEARPPATWFREWLTRLPRLVEFAEVAPERAGEDIDPATRLQELSLERMRGNPALTFGEAFREVCAASPSLAAEYLDDVS